jgi:hypothetical protein
LLDTNPFDNHSLRRFRGRVAASTSGAVSDPVNEKFRARGEGPAHVAVGEVYQVGLLVEFGGYLLWTLNYRPGGIKGQAHIQAVAAAPVPGASSLLAGKIVVPEQVSLMLALAAPVLGVADVNRIAVLEEGQPSVIAPPALYPLIALLVMVVVANDGGVEKQRRRLFLEGVVS